MLSVSLPSRSGLSAGHVGSTSLRLVSSQNIPAYLGRSSILVVEDEDLIRVSLCDELRLAGYSVVEAINADHAVVILNAGSRFDLIISDVRMPGTLDGLGLLALVKRAYPDIPVVITSGHLPGAAALAGGASQFLAKPYSLGNVIDVIEGELARSQ